MYLLTKQEFTTLYRFGEIPLNTSRAVHLSEHPEEEDIIELKDVLKTIPLLKDNEDFVFLDIEMENTGDTIRIEDAKRVIPQTHEAKKQLTDKFGGKILFYEALFEKLVTETKERIEKEKERLKKDRRDTFYYLSSQELESLQLHHILPKVRDVFTEDEAKNILKNLTSFLEDEEYFVLDVFPLEQDSEWIHIRDVHSVIPFTAKSQHFLKQHFKSFSIAPPRFTELKQELEKEGQIIERNKGVEVACDLFDVENIIKDQELHGLIEYVSILDVTGKKREQTGDIRQEDKIVDLLYYTSKGIYPKEDVRYLFDVNELSTVLAHTPLYYDKTKFFQNLQTNKKDLLNKPFTDLYDYFESYEKREVMEKHLAWKCYKMYAVAIIFLKLRDRLKEDGLVKDLISESLLADLKQDRKFEKEFELAVNLIGLLFGYERFYNDYYIKKGILKEAKETVSEENANSNQEGNSNQESDGGNLKTEEFSKAFKQYIDNQKQNIEGDYIELKNKAYTELKDLVQKHDSKSSNNKDEVIKYVKDHISDKIFEIDTKGIKVNEKGTSNKQPEIPFAK